MTKALKTARILLAMFLSGILTSGGYAIAPGNGASIKDREVSKGSYGAPLGCDEKGLKVFEIRNTSSKVLVLDEAGSAPTNGTLKFIAISSVATAGYFTVYDASSTTTAAMSVSESGHALFPPIRAAVIPSEKVTAELNVQFHRGLVGEWTTSDKEGAWIYWCTNGGRH